MTLAQTGQRSNVTLKKKKWLEAIVAQFYLDKLYGEMIAVGEPARWN